MLGKHCMKHWSSAQTSIPFSSGEGEFAGEIRGAAVHVGGAVGAVWQRPVLGGLGLWPLLQPLLQPALQPLLGGGGQPRGGP